MGEQWGYLTNYIYDFEWAQSKYAVSKGVQIPDSRIFVTRDAKAQGHQLKVISSGTRWSTEISLFVSDDFYKTNAMLLSKGNTIVKSPQYMFIAVANSDNERIKIYSSNFVQK